jgi:hypothetical protein
MTIKTLSKNSIGVVLALLLVILLSESRLFKFFTDTYLGRASLIIILLMASYLNKILGVVCVFIIIIMFNNNNSFYEGITDMKNGDSTTMKESDSTTSTSSTTKSDTSSTQPTMPIKVTTSTTTKDTSDPKDPKEKTSKPDSTSSTGDSIATPATKSIEGFDLQSTENSIKRGKQSNSIPVSQYNKQSVEVAPYEQSNFSNLFGLL